MLNVRLCAFMLLITHVLEDLSHLLLKFPRVVFRRFWFREVLLIINKIRIILSTVLIKIPIKNVIWTLIDNTQNYQNIDNIIHIAFILGDLLHLSPSETILFQKSTNNEFVGNVEILNVYKKPVTYKVSDPNISLVLLQIII